MEKVPPQVRAKIITILGHRGDKCALPTLLKALDDKNNTVRFAAIDAAVRLGGNDALGALLALMQSP